MATLTKTFNTHSREQFIQTCRQYTPLIIQKIKENGDNPVKISITGDYASGKSLIADTIKAELIQQGIEAPEWKRIENYNTKLDNKSISVSFINARYDGLNILFNYACNQRAHKAGLIFISNRPKFNIAQLFNHPDPTSPDIEFNIKIPDTDPKPKQLGPFKYGKSYPIKNRSITVTIHNHNDPLTPNI